MTLRPLRWLAVPLALIMGGAVLAQNPVSITQVGTATPVTTAVPVTPMNGAGSSALVDVVTPDGSVLGVVGTLVSTSGLITGGGAELDNNFGTVAPAGAYTSALFTLDTSAATYTAVFQALTQTGTWAGITVYDLAGNPVTSVSGAGVWSGNVAGFKAARIMMTTFSGKFGPNGAITVSPVSTLVTVSTSSPCEVPTPTTVPFSFASSTVQKVITKAAGLRNYICNIVFVAGAAEIVNVLEGTKSSTECDTGTIALAGSTTVANGMSFAANEGLAAIGGKGAAIPGIGTNVDTCLATNGSNRVAGWLTEVQR